MVTHFDDVMNGNGVFYQTRFYFKDQRVILLLVLRFQNKSKLARND